MPDLDEKKAVEVKQRETQPTRNEGWTSSKPEEEVSKQICCGAIREGDH
jgi:hypothetical protein